MGIMSSKDYRRELKSCSYLSRTLCDVLSDMRKCFDTHNYSPMLSLIEEAQIMGNRMEAKLYEKKDVESLTTLKKQIEEDIERLRKLEQSTDHEVKHLVQED